MKKADNREGRTGTTASPYTHDTDGRLQCRVCGKRFIFITPRHLAQHGMTVDDYRERYGLSYLLSNAYRRRLSRQQLRKFPENDYRPLNREQILRTLRRYAKVNRTLPSSFVRAAAPEVHHQALHIFGTWPEVRQALGLHPNPIRHWSEEEIIRAIWRHEEQGHTLTSREMKKRDRKLVAIACTYFKTWKNAIEMSGIDYEAVTLTKDRSPQVIARDLKAWSLAHGPLNFKRLRETDGAFTLAVLRRYGSIQAAARALQVPFRPERPSWPGMQAVVKRKRANRERILRLVNGARKAGIPAADITRALPRATRDQVKNLLRELKRNGEVEVRGLSRRARWFPASAARGRKANHRP